MSSIRRGHIGRYLDQLFGWMNRLPSESCSYTVESLRIPVGDEITLAADLYRPETIPLGTLLVRSPYGIGLVPALSNARAFACRGYQVLFTSCRGTFDSGGEFDPGRHEAADGHATLTWMRKQLWYTGSFATLGASYLGYTQWSLLSDPPEDMKAAVINTGPHDFSKFIWGTGALDTNMIAWADLQRRMKRGDSFVSIVLALRSQKDRLEPVFSSVPLLDAVDKFFEGEPPAWLRRILTCSDLSDPCWQPLRQEEALKKATIPIFLTAGWDDLILPDVMEQYEALKKRGSEVALTVGPWTHLGAGGRNNLPQVLQWLETHLAGRTDDVRESPVRVFVTGKGEWRSLPEWPPSTSPKEFFLSPKKILTQNMPSDETPDFSFVFDPADPTPSVGYPLLFDNGPGRAGGDDSLATRSDVLVFTTPALDSDIEICGKPRIELHHSTSSPHADLLVIVSEVKSKGKSRSITEKYLRLDPGQKPGLTSIELNDCAHSFGQGTRIRLMIAGGSHPRYLRNSGMEGDPAIETAMQKVTHTITAASKLILPVV